MGNAGGGGDMERNGEREQTATSVLLKRNICVDGKCWRCAWARRVTAGKHLTHREKSKICQAHSEIKP